MKKLFSFLALLSFLSLHTNAQNTGMVDVINYTDCEVQFSLYARCPSDCSTSYVVGFVYTIPAFSGGNPGYITIDPNDISFPGWINEPPCTDWVWWYGMFSYGNTPSSTCSFFVVVGDDDTCPNLPSTAIPIDDDVTINDDCNCGNQGASTLRARWLPSNPPSGGTTQVTLL